MKKLAVLLISLITGIQLFGQLSPHLKILVNANNTVAPPFSGTYHTYHDIVPELTGQGVQLFNIQMNNFAIPPIGTSTIGPLTYGKFVWDGTSDIGIDSGMVMGTGWIPPTDHNFSYPLVPGDASGITWPAKYNTGANNNGGHSIQGFSLTDSIRWDQYQDLVALNYGGRIADANILEFDFVPDSNHIALDYVFASEEYPNMDDPTYPSTVCDTPNDVMGIFLSGPGISGEQNIALVPGTDIPVGVNTITPPGWNCNGLPDYSQYYVDNTGGQNVIYNGFTKVLTAKAKVIPGATYHLKIGVADGARHPETTDTLPPNYSDPLLGFYDSGIFLKFGSFRSYYAEDTTNGISSTAAGTPEISISPNPFNKDFQLYLKTPDNQVYHLQLTDALGRTILIHKGTIATLNHQLAQAGLGKLSAGNYFLKIWANGDAAQNAMFKLSKTE